MPNSLSATGLTTATQTELQTQFTAGLQTIYGQDINVESDTPDGQWMNLIIQAIVDLGDLQTQIYNSFDPDNAIGVVLDQRVAINGIQRIGATYTTTNVNLVTNQVVNLYGLDQDVQSIYTIADSAGNQWQLVTTQLNVQPGTSTFLFQSATPGVILSTPNTITVPVSVILGVTSVNNPNTYSTLGIAEESDASLKIRRQKSVSLQSQGYFQGLLAALENINGVTSAYVNENDTAGTVNGIPSHSIWVIVAGSPNTPLATIYNSTTTYAYGNIASSGGINYISIQNNNLNNPVTSGSYWQVYNPIAEAIYNYRNAGCGMYNSGDAGANSYAVGQIDGSFFTVYWDTVISENLFIKFIANSLNGSNPPNITGIQSYLVSNFEPGVSGEVNINQLATLVQQADANTLVTSSGFSTSSGGSYTNTLSPAALNKQFSVQSANIIITPMIMACANGVQVISGGLVTTTNVSVAHGGNTIQFSALGGFGTMTYSMVSGGGSINSSSGLYTSGIAGNDVAQVEDGLGNIATATITVT